MTWSSSGPGPLDWPLPFTRRPKASRSWCSTADAFGGQAGASTRIENYLGFPTGITGMALMARAYTQAQKFGAEMAIPDEAVSLEGDGVSGGGPYVVTSAQRAREFAPAPW